MKGIMKYMTRFAGKIVGFSLAFAVGMFVYLLLLEGRITEIASVGFENIALLIPAMGCLFLFIYGCGNMPVIFDMELSMGATRKECAKSFLYAQYLSALVLALVAGLLHLILGHEGAGLELIYFLIALAALIFAASLSVFVGMLVDRLGKVAYYILVGVVALVAGMLGGWGGAALASEATISLSLSGAGGLSGVLTIAALALLGLGILLALVACLTLPRFVKNRAVRV